MSDRPDKEQMMKIVMPALAIAVVIVLIGVIIAFRDNPDTSAPADGKKPNPTTPTDLPAGVKAEDVNTDGTTLEKPSETAPEWKDAGDGLKVWDVKEGSGLPCVAGAKAVMHYTGWMLNGSIFDSSVKRGTVSDLPPLSGLIEGWQKGVPGMKPGGIRRLYIPWSMAYGAEGDGRKIPPKADLIFEIKYFGSK